MSKEDFYADKIFKMVEHGMGLVRPWGTLDSADKDFLSFERKLTNIMKSVFFLTLR